MNAIKTALKAKGWNHGDLMRALEADGISVCRSTISNWSRGERAPTEPAASAIGRILSIEVEAAVFGRHWKVYDVYVVTSRRHGRQGRQRSVTIRTPSGASLAKGTESGSRGNVAPILIEGLKASGRLAPWAVEAYSSHPQDIAHAQELAIALRQELSRGGDDS